MVTMRIELSERWLKFVKSPAAVFMTALTCLSLTFAPVALFNLGKAGVDYRDTRVIACFAVIVLVPLVYVKLATLLINQLRAAPDGLPATTPGASATSTASVWPWVLLVLSAVIIYLLLRP